MAMSGHQDERATLAARADVAPDAKTCSGNSGLHTTVFIGLWPRFWVYIIIMIKNKLYINNCGFIEF